MTAEASILNSVAPTGQVIGNETPPADKVVEFACSLLSSPSSVII
jgi:hypothetical protein